MDMNGQLHAPDAVRPGERPPVYTEKKARWAPRAGVDTPKKRKSHIITGESNHSPSNVQSIA
jgi:hypothetical protein